MTKYQKIFYYLKREIRGRIRQILQPAIIQIDGVKLAVKNAAVSKMMRQHIYAENYEFHERMILNKTLVPEDVILEIGSGMGLISLLCAKKVAHRNIHSFEANPDLISVIEANFKLNNVMPQVNNVILGHDEGAVDFYLREDFWASSTIKPESGSYKTVTIKKQSFQKTLQDIKPTYLICDIEGGEYDLLSHADLRSVSKICLEIHPHALGYKKCADLLSNLLKQGFCMDFMKSQKNIIYLFREDKSDFH